MSLRESVDNFGTRLLKTIFVRFLKNCIYPGATDTNPDVLDGPTIDRVWNSVYHRAWKSNKGLNSLGLHLNLQSVIGLLHSHPVLKVTCLSFPLDWQHVSVAKTGLSCLLMAGMAAAELVKRHPQLLNTRSLSEVTRCCLCLLQQFNFNILPTVFLPLKLV